MRGWLASSSVILAGGVLVVGSAMALDRARPPDKVAADRVSFPDAERLRPLCFGFTEVAADLVWIQTLLYYSAHINLDQQFPWLDRMSETALDLDPRFAGAYRWCSATATWKTSNRTSISEVDFLLANHYAELGMRRLPEDWQFPYLLGANWFYDRDDSRRAAYYWQIAAQLPGAEARLFERLSNVHRRLGETEKAIIRTQDLLSLTTEPGQRAEIERRLALLEHQLASELSSMPPPGDDEE